MVKFYATNAVIWWAITGFLLVMCVAGWLVLSFGHYSSSKYGASGVKDAQSIVVLTGGSERILAGLLLERSGVTPRPMYISGIGSSANASEILARYPGFESIFECCVTFGHAAKSTCGNAQETSRWLRQRKLDSVALVTSDYHMARARLELERLWSEGRVIAVPTSEIMGAERKHSSWQWLSELAKFSVTRLTGGIIPCRLGPSSDARW